MAGEIKLSQQKLTQVANGFMQDVASKIDEYLHFL